MRPARIKDDRAVEPLIAALRDRRSQSGKMPWKPLER
jgi:hypothetical protein